MNPHELLLADIVALLRDAANYKFHCFKAPDSIATPKVDIVSRLTYLREKATRGSYDNEPDTEDLADMKQICIDQKISSEMMKAIFGKEAV